MIDENSHFMAILTAIGEAKQANANALGIPWVISEMGVGDANGIDPVPLREQTALINERRRAPVNQLKIDPDIDSMIVAEHVIPANVGGFWIRELGLYDDEGDLIAVANCPPTFKPELSQGSVRTQVVRINILVSSTKNIQLKVDPAVVLATREYVEKALVRASQTEAEEGKEKTKVMTPERTAQAIAALGLKLGTTPGRAVAADDPRLGAGGVGVDQTWQVMTASRSLNTTYTNTTDKPIMISVVLSHAIGSGQQTSAGAVGVYIGGKNVFNTWSIASPGAPAATLSAQLLVPAGTTYNISASVQGLSIRNWSELR